MILLTFEIMATLVGIGCVGFWIVSKKLIPENVLPVLSALVTDVSLPALVFFNIVTKFPKDNVGTTLLLPLYWFGFMAILFVLVWSIGLIFFVENRSEMRVSLFYPNAIFVPLAILPVLYGSDSPILTELFIMTMFFAALLFNTFYLFFKPSKQMSFEWKKVLNPILISTIIALLLVLTKTSGFIPQFVIQITQKIGLISLPLIMLIVGGSIFLDIKNQRKIYVKEVLQFIGVKHLILPLIILGLLYIIRMPNEVAFLLFIQAIVPPVTIIPVLTAKAKGNSSLVGQCLVVSFLVSIVTIPVSIDIFYRLF